MSRFREATLLSVGWHGRVPPLSRGLKSEWVKITGVKLAWLVSGCAAVGAGGSCLRASTDPASSRYRHGLQTWTVRLSPSAPNGIGWAMGTTVFRHSRFTSY